MELEALTPADIKNLCRDIGLDQADLAQGLSVPAATWYRYMKPADGSGIPPNIRTLLIAFQGAIRSSRRSSGDAQEIKDALKTVGVSGIVARAAMEGVLPLAIVQLLVRNPITAWVGAIVPLSGIAISGFAALSGLAFLDRFKKTRKQKEIDLDKVEETDAEKYPASAAIGQKPGAGKTHALFGGRVPGRKPQEGAKAQIP